MMHTNRIFSNLIYIHQIYYWPGELNFSMVKAMLSWRACQIYCGTRYLFNLLDDIPYSSLSSTNYVEEGIVCLGFGFLNYSSIVLIQCFWGFSYWIKKCM